MAHRCSVVTSDVVELSYQKHEARTLCASPASRTASARGRVCVRRLCGTACDVCVRKCFVFVPVCVCQLLRQRGAG